MFLRRQAALSWLVSGGTMYSTAFCFCCVVCFSSASVRNERIRCFVFQVVFLDATEILITEEARLITFVNKGGHRETMALLRVLEEER